MFGSLFFERDPLRFKDLGSELTTWAQVFGGVAAVALVVWLILRERGVVRKNAFDVPDWLAMLFRVGLLVTLVAYGPVLVTLLYDLWVGVAAMAKLNPPGSSMEARVQRIRGWRDLSLTCGGAFALLTICLPFLHNLASQRWRRIWALARLSFKEAIRRRVLYAFAGMLLVFLFGSWFITSKPEDQVRSYVQVVYWGMTPVLLLAAVILAAFSIPADIRQQTIHTIVTKPVERFEIVLGRFLGFSALMTLVLLVFTAASLVYVLRGVDPDAAAESLKAREPVNGELRFENTGAEQGENVGREWDYRRYITGIMQEGQPPPTAVWEIPAGDVAPLAGRQSVRCEYNFDIYRTHKGTENKGISCNFYFIAPGAKGTPADFNRLLAERTKAGAGNTKSAEEVERELAEELGVYVKLSQEVTDYHTQVLNVPGALFRTAAAGGAPLQVRVTCNDRAQYVGMAKYDLYLRQDDPDAGEDRLRFAANFFKGAAGLWLRLVLVTGLAVALSTYFSGVIALLVTLMVYVGGLSRDFIAEVATGQNAGGGPLEAGYRLLRNENIIAPLQQTTAFRFATSSDVAFRWLIGLVSKLIPDVDQFDLTRYVAEGFNVPFDQLAVHLLLLVLYVLPWAVLAYYLIRWREIASSS